MISKKMCFLLKISLYLSCLLFGFKSQSVLASECPEYLKINLKVLDQQPEDLPLDSIFYNTDGSVKILKVPFVWSLKDQDQNLVGYLVGSSHDYISLNMFPDSFRTLLANISVVMTEHSSKKNGELNNALIKENFDPAAPSLYMQLSQTERERVMDDFLDYQFIKAQASVLLSRELYSPKNNFNLVNLSPYGFMDRLSEIAQIATSELRTQPIQLDDQIARLAQFNGARWSYLEEGPDHLIQFADGFTVDQVRQLLMSSENIFEDAYFLLREFLIQYRDGDLTSFKKYVDNLTDLERQKFLTDRNKLWIPKITGQLQKNKLTLVVAGAYHFVGQDNVVQLLESEGYLVERHSLE